MVKKSNVRLLTKTLAVVSLLAPVSSQALGIGEITLHSALNQNLNAEISLVLSGENVSDIKVKLAPPEKFDEAGVSWTYFLSKIKFETMTQSNGSAIIKLTSNEALKEPFLDFLLEVSWPKGNLYRGFTVLVDPPSAYNQATFPVSTRTEGYAQPSVVTPQSQAYANGQSSEGEYGPTLSNDTLWSVAERTRGQGDVSVEQMMIAIYQANPHAFNKGNAHGLTAGKMLKIPERGIVLKLSRNQALTEFKRQTKAWKKRSAPASGDTEKAKPALRGVEVSVDNQLTLAAPAKQAVADHAVITSANESEDSDKDAADQSEVVKGNHAEGNVSAAVSADGVLQSKISGLEKQLAMMQELIALKDQQFAALQKRSLANPVAQQQVLPGEDTAARLENQTMTTPQQTVVQPAEPPQPVPGEMVTAKPADQITPVSQPTVVQSAEAVRPLAQPEPETSSLLDTYYLVVGSAGTVILTLLGWLWWRKRKVDEETNTESMFASTIMVEASAVDENISVPIVETSLAVQDNDTGTVGESSFLSEFTPSDFDSFDTDQGEIDPISEADVYLAYGRYQQAEELIRQAIKDQPDRDECKLKLLEIFYANESKADFEAYAAELAKNGKRNEAEFWEKAAEMGREICPDSPLFSSGDDLFAMVEDEVVESTGESITADNALNMESVMTGVVSFIKSGDDAFVKEATELKNDALDFDLTSSDDVIAGTQRNNEDIDFDLSSFSMDTNTSNEAEKDAIDPSVQVDALSREQVEDVNFDLSPFSIEFDGADQGVIAPNTITGKSLGATSESIDFDLSSFSIESDNGVIAFNTQTGSPSVAHIEDFDLSSFSMDANETDKADQDFTGSDALLSSLPEASVDKYDAHDFDFSFDHAEKKEVDSLDFSALESNDSLSFDDDMDGDFDFNFDLDLAPTRKDQDSGQYEEFGVSAFTDRDALETKLDLAKAYVDMGDADAAKDLAREVLDQGTVEQKNIAQTLLDELG
ncbi:FimV/HubP family polar landmark protein [Methylobacter sp. G7]|uniref:FimV/HubP family polar landmark protein n=1 Tax=Methylobacter sp. G7 TaxID=3230117 RepID=UPI003D800BFE